MSDQKSSIPTRDTAIITNFFILFFPTFHIDHVFNRVFVVFLPLQAVSDSRAESSSPPGGSGANHTVWSGHLVQSSFPSLPLGTILLVMEYSCF